MERNEIEKHPRVKEYSRNSFRRETSEIIDDLYVDVIWTKYCDMDLPFWQTPSDEFLREIGDID